MSTQMLSDFITDFKCKYPLYQNTEIEAFQFGNSIEMADDLAELVAIGKKTGTSSLQKAYAIENEEIPKVDDISIVLNGKKEPVCVIQNINVEILTFNKIDSTHAFKEGEGDLTLSYWRKVHWDFFMSLHKKYFNQPFTETELIVYEEFKIIYKRG